MFSAQWICRCWWISVCEWDVVMCMCFVLVPFRDAKYLILSYFYDTLRNLRYVTEIIVTQIVAPKNVVTTFEKVFWPQLKDLTRFLQYQHFSSTKMFHIQITAVWNIMEMSEKSEKCELPSILGCTTDQDTHTFFFKIIILYGYMLSVGLFNMVPDEWPCDTQMNKYFELVEEWGLCDSNCKVVRTVTIRLADVSLTWMMGWCGVRGG